MSNFAYFPGPNPYLPPKNVVYILFPKTEYIIHFTSYQKKNQLNFYHNIQKFYHQIFQSKLSHGFEMSNDISCKK